MHREDFLRVAVVAPSIAKPKALIDPEEEKFYLPRLDRGRILRDILDFTYENIRDVADRYNKRIDGHKVQLYESDEKTIHPILHPKRAEPIESADIVVTVNPTPTLIAYLSRTTLSALASRGLFVWSDKEVHAHIDTLLAQHRLAFISANGEGEFRVASRIFGYGVDPEESEIEWERDASFATRDAVRYPHIRGTKVSRDELMTIKQFTKDDPESKPSFRGFLVDEDLERLDDEENEY